MTEILFSLSKYCSHHTATNITRATFYFRCFVSVNAMNSHDIILFTFFSLTSKFEWFISLSIEDRMCNINNLTFPFDHANLHHINWTCTLMPIHTQLCILNSALFQCANSRNAIFTRFFRVCNEIQLCMLGGNEHGCLINIVNKWLKKTEWFVCIGMTFGCQSQCHESFSSLLAAATSLVEI